MNAIRNIIAACALSVLSVTPLLAADETLYYENRADIPQAYTWDLGLYFEDAAAWDAAFSRLEARLPEMAQYRGRVGESPERMAAALAASLGLYRELFPLYINAHQKVSLQQDDALGGEQAGRINSLYARVQEATSFVDPEIAQLAPGEIARFTGASALQPYRQYLDDIWRLREHVRSPEVEEVLAGSSPSGSAHLAAKEGLFFGDIEWPVIAGENGEELVVSPGQYFSLMSSSNRDLRQRAFEAHMGTVKNYRNAAAAALAGKIQRDVWLARVYRYDSSLEAALAQTNVPVAVMETLLAAVHDNTDKIQGYAELRRRILGLDKLQPWDRSVALLPEGGRRYSFDEAWQLAMQFWRQTFGEEFAAIAQEARENRWVDVYTSKGKTDGAYSWGSYGQAQYLLLNWGGRFEDVSTLVHEMGHSVHGVLADRNQSFHNAGTDLFVAEVASVASESLFSEWMLERTRDPDERRLLIDHALTSLRDTFVTQIFFHEWEASVHAMAESGEALTPDSMSRVYAELYRSYYGDTVGETEFDGYHWARIDHFYSNFYVWKYATSYAAGEALAARFRSGDKRAAQDYLKMLKLGGSVYPLEVLQAGGVDMTDPAVIRAVMHRFGELQQQLAAEYGL